jgi:hypothetical protein
MMFSKADQSIDREKKSKKNLFQNGGWVSMDLPLTDCMETHYVGYYP